MAEKSDFVGVWKLVSFAFHAADGSTSYPYGLEPRGYIIYTANGYMSVGLMPSGRPNFESAEMLSGSIEEKAGAADTFLSYCGTYDVEGDQVVHHIEVSLMPNWTCAVPARLTGEGLRAISGAGLFILKAYKPTLKASSVMPSMRSQKGDE